MLVDYDFDPRFLQSGVLYFTNIVGVNIQLIKALYDYVWFKITTIPAKALNSRVLFNYTIILNVKGDKA